MVAVDVSSEIDALRGESLAPSYGSCARDIESAEELSHVGGMQHARCTRLQGHEVVAIHRGSVPQVRSTSKVKSRSVWAIL